MMMMMMMMKNAKTTELFEDKTDASEKFPVAQQPQECGKKSENYSKKYK